MKEVITNPSEMDHQYLIQLEVTKKQMETFKNYN